MMVLAWGKTSPLLNSYFSVSSISHLKRSNSIRSSVAIHSILYFLQCPSYREYFLK
jgi:hypothetical protein